ncbi:hypothetical protein [Ancrocorticia sp.]|uniref:hypothetical protein n=1 Tax=Ancrocorticia sp. TaxID=2593684 RepID=UPI003F91AD68
MTRTPRKGRLSRPILAFTIGLALLGMPAMASADTEESQDPTPEALQAEQPTITSFEAEPDAPYCPSSEVTVVGEIDNFVNGSDGTDGSELVLTFAGSGSEIELTRFSSLPEDGTFNYTVTGLDAPWTDITAYLYHEGDLVDEDTVELTVQNDCIASFTQFELSPEGPYCTESALAVNGHINDFVEWTPEERKGNRVKFIFSGPSIGIIGIPDIVELPADGNFTVELGQLPPGDYSFTATLYGYPSPAESQIGIRTLNFTVDAECPTPAPELADLAFEPPEIVLESADATGSSSITGSVVNYVEGDAVSAVLLKDVPEGIQAQEAAPVGTFAGEIAADGSFTIALSDLEVGEYSANVSISRADEVQDTQSVSGLSVTVDETSDPDPEPTEPDPEPEPTEPGDPHPTKPSEPEPSSSASPKEPGELPNTGASVLPLVLVSLGAVASGLALRRKAA